MCHASCSSIGASVRIAGFASGMVSRVSIASPFLFADSSLWVAAQEYSPILVNMEHRPVMINNVKVVSKFRVIVSCLYKLYQTVPHNSYNVILPKKNSYNVINIYQENFEIMFFPVGRERQREKSHIECI